MQTGRTSAKSDGFKQFYNGAYRNDHATMGNRVFHIVGTLAGLALIAASLTILPLWWAFAFPVVHAGPGLIGHRLFERNSVLGDVRVFQGMYPGHWYMLANHIMTGHALLDILTLRARRRQGR
jgi:hypothetical protein